MGNSEVSRWIVEYRDHNASRYRRSFVAKKFNPPHSREISIWRWLQSKTTINMPTLVDYRDNAGDANSWMLTENWVNYKDDQFECFTPLHFTSMDSDYPACAREGPDLNAFVWALAQLHGKTLGVNWEETESCPIPRYQVPKRLTLSIDEMSNWIGGQAVKPDQEEMHKLKSLRDIVETANPIALHQELSEHSALSHGDIDFQEVGYRPLPLDWGFFDWEMCRIAPIYFDIATVHYQLGIPLNNLRLSHYVQEVGRLSGVKLDAEKVMELMDVGLIFCLQRWTRVAWNHETDWSEEGLEDTFRRGLDKILLTLKQRRSK